MRLEAPSWWYRKRGALAAALGPLGALYGRIAEARGRRTPTYSSALPVICIGNFIAGGAGKTPTAIAVASLLQELGRRPVFLTRGYGGEIRGPHRVTETDRPNEVGDEPMLLAAQAPTVVAADRAEGARLIEALDGDVIVMDDGLQNRQLAKDLSLVVVDAKSGIGNGLVMPAGPLRAPLEPQLERADGLIVIGEDQAAEPLAKSFAERGKPVLKARIVPRGDPRWLGVLPVIAFAGIARPEKFYATLGSNGARVIDCQSFPDHHRYSDRQAAKLLRQAKEQKAMLVTTEKDWVRLPEDDSTPLGELKHRSRPLPIAIQFEDEAAVKDLLSKAIAKRRA